MNSEIARLEERMGELTAKIAECHQVIQVAQEAWDQLQNLRIELKNVMDEYIAEVENQEIRVIR